MQKVALKGHTDWIRALDFTIDASGDVLLASGSQDRYIRLWRFTATQSADDGENSLFGAFGKSISGGFQFSTKAHMIQIDQNASPLSIYLDAVLMGHDDWVYSVKWQPSSNLDKFDANGNEIKNQSTLRLLSSSADKSMMLWEPDTESGVWVNTIQVGEIGGKALGVFGALWSPDGQAVAGHGFHGAFHIWQRVGTDNGSEFWQPRIGISGHFAPVQDLAWDPSGSFLATVGLDQTTRVFAPWHQNDNNPKAVTWHEIARPQIHGYDMHCLAFVNHTQFASGAEGEKIARVFSMPRTFADSLANITGEQHDRDMGDDLPLGASLPPLGLSNKPVEVQSIPFADAALASFHEVNQATVAQALAQPPFEEHLLQFALWPEHEKLYGHSYEIFALAAAQSGRLLASASACRAAGNPEDAAIRLWDTKSWRETQSPLLSHSLTITTLKFSWNEEFLLSAGRDRMWSVFRRTDDGSYELMQRCAKAHARIIWSADWSYEDRLFATGSRDKTVKVWTMTGAEFECVATLKFDESVTAVQFSPVPFTVDNQEFHLLAVGFEDGGIQMMQCRCDAVNEWQPAGAVNRQFTHAATVKKLGWRVIAGDLSAQKCPVKTIDRLRHGFQGRIHVSGDAPTLRFDLASCSEDGSVRIFSSFK